MCVQITTLYILNKTKTTHRFVLKSQFREEPFALAGFVAALEFLLDHAQRLLLLCGLFHRLFVHNGLFEINIDDAAKNRGNLVKIVIFGGFLPKFVSFDQN